jgi:multiple sugar transport system ATP-binding protein
MIELRGIGKVYDDRSERAALSEIDLTIAEGEFVAIVGPSGCGKSTLLSILAGLEAPSVGTITIDGKPATDASPKERGVALVFQSYALYPHLDVRRNVAFPLEIEKRPKAEIAARVEETARRLSIGHLLDRKPRALSGGERQRVALARAIVRRPRICLFDEPLSNLDPALRSAMRAEIKALHEELSRDAGSTFVWVTHDQAEAMTLADRVVVLRAGHLRQVGPPREIYRRPADVFVAGFFGAPPMNFLDDQTRGVRPEDVDAGLGDGPEGALSGRVILVEPLGAETWLTVDVPGIGPIVGRAPRDLEVGAARPSGWVRWSREAELAFGSDGRLRAGPRRDERPGT